MAASIAIEEEWGTFTGERPAHRGYYAGDFADVPVHSISRIRPQSRTTSKTAVDALRDTKRVGVSKWRWQ